VEPAGPCPSSVWCITPLPWGSSQPRHRLFGAGFSSDVTGDGPHTKRGHPSKARIQSNRAVSRDKLVALTENNIRDQLIARTPDAGSVVPALHSTNELYQRFPLLFRRRHGSRTIIAGGPVVKRRESLYYESTQGGDKAYEARLGGNVTGSPHQKGLFAGSLGLKRGHGSTVDKSEGGLPYLARTHKHPYSTHTSVRIR
jgi:hypothetical protein